MNQTVSIGIIGDYDEANPPPKPEVINAINHAATHLSYEINTVWLPTSLLLTNEAQRQLMQCHGIYTPGGSPYRSQEVALMRIRLAREQNIPFFGT